jgi:tetratricopeptide (TPR) repeat protein
MDNSVSEEGGTGIEFLDCAAELTETINNLDSCSELMALNAMQYAELGLTGDAVDIADRIGDPYTRDRAFANIAARFLEGGQAELADEQLQKIEDDSLYAMALEQLAMKHAETGQFETAVEVAGELADSAPTLGAVAALCAEAGDLDKAVELASSIDYPESRAAAMCQIARKAIGLGRINSAIEILSLATVAKEEVEFAKERVDSLLTIAAVQEELGNKEAAAELLSSAYVLCKGVGAATDGEVLTGEDRDGALAHIAVGFARLENFSRADAAIDKIEDPFHLASALAAVAGERRNTGHSDEANASFAQAMDILKEEKVFGERTLNRRDAVVGEMARIEATGGRYEQALELAQMIESIDGAQAALEEIARACVRTGKSDWPFTALNSIERRFNKGRFLLRVGDAFVERGEMEAGEKAYSEAVDQARKTEALFDRAVVLGEAAERFAQRDQLDKSSELFLESVSTAALLSDVPLKARIITFLAIKSRAVGHTAGEEERRIMEEILVKAQG